MLARTNLATAKTTNCPKTHDAAIMAFTAAALIGLTAILGTIGIGPPVDQDQVPSIFAGP